MSESSPQAIASAIPETLCVLVVEDSPADAELVRLMLEDSTRPRFRALHAPDVNGALAALQAETVDAVLLDLSLPDAWGLHGLELLRKSSPGVPVVVFTGNRDEKVGVEAVHMGAQGYLMKDEASAPLLARCILHALERQRMLAEIELTRERERYFATHDTLTGLPNRALLNDRLAQAFAWADRNETQLALLVIDLDGFKAINDSLGHAAGDVALRCVGWRLDHMIRASDSVARVGGDEFVIICNHLNSPEGALQVAQKVVDVLSEPITIQGRAHRLGASVGVALYPDHGDHAAEVLRRADLSMYRAKESGRNRFVVYDAAMEEPEHNRPDLHARLGRVLEKEQLELYYQPLVDVRGKRIAGVEALLRWRDPSSGLVPPADFLPQLEEAGLMLPVGEWVLRNACAQLGEWQRAGFGSLRMAVNLSPRQLLHGEFPAAVAAVLEESGVDPSLLELEISEGALVQDSPAIRETMLAIHELGVRFAVDDFGTGYSSLAYLKRLPVSALKIDGSFVRALTREGDDRTICGGIITVARGLGLEAVAEAVEQVEQLEILADYGCTLMQGFYFGEPVPPALLGRRLLEPALPRQKPRHSRE